MTPQMKSNMTWAWCIATYQRHAVLRRALATVFAQSRLPSELIIVDSSVNWEEGRTLIRADVDQYQREMGIKVRMEYIQGEKASLTVQRTQGIRLARADVLFLTDDDTLLYADCAEKIMEVYERDEACRIQAVAAVPVKSPPESFPACGAGEGANSLPTQGAVPHYHPVVAAVRKLLKADDRFVPYDDEFPRHAIPPDLVDLPLALRSLVAGYALTCRRDAAIRDGFDGRLERYCPGEDSDFTYRLTRVGPIVARLDARICHLEAGSGRMASFHKTALGAINPLLFHRVHSTDLRRSAVRNRQLLRRRLIIEALKDLRNGDWGLPQARGIYVALRAIDEIMNCPDQDVDDLFRSYQRQYTGLGSNLKN